LQADADSVSQIHNASAAVPEKSDNGMTDNSLLVAKHEKSRAKGPGLEMQSKFDQT